MPIKLIRNFIKLESSAGIVLFIAAIVAIIIDNSSFAPHLEHLLATPITIQVGEFALSKHLLHWVNEGLMVMFFLLVGLEVKREFIKGELNSISKAILPAAAAVGGMAVPALIFTLFNFDNAFSMKGWAIPTATDIAFSLGILSLLSARVPVSLKIFLTALAIFDDIGAIIIIAIFYTADLSLLSLALASMCVMVLTLLNYYNVKGYAPYFLVGTVLWVCLLKSGVHATLSGVILAMAIPLKNEREAEGFSPLENLMRKLHPWIAYLVLPIFAFANAGVSFDDVPPGLNNIFSPVMLGIACGLVFGKLIGVFATTFIAVKLGLTKKPTDATWPQILGITFLCGVGFTMSFFVGSLAYPGGSTTEPYNAWVRFGVILGSLVAGVLGYIILRYTTRVKTNN